MPQLKLIVLLGIAGAAGTLARYGAGRLAAALLGTHFPFGTLLVNVTGAFLAGFIWYLMEFKYQWNELYATVILVGFLGAFTTFSAFVLESGRMIHAADIGKAVLNVFVQNCVGFGALFLGILCAMLVIRLTD